MTIYGRPNQIEIILEALRKHGINVDALTREDLSVFDEFHSGGMGGTQYLADMANLKGVPAGSKALDIGSGIGGPARTLAAEFGFVVTGLEPNEEFLNSAQELTRRLGMTDVVDFVPGFSTYLPFEDGSFDMVWTQNVLMNIEDKVTTFKEINRVLRSGGSVVFQSVVSGPNPGFEYPVPWADDESTNFLVPASELRSIAAASGLTELHWFEGTPDTATPFPPIDPDSINFGLIMNRDWPLTRENMQKNGGAGRMNVAWGVFKKN